MEPLKPFQPIAIPAILVLLISLLLSVNGQISTPCTASMLSTFTPCLNYITGSSGNGSSPTGDCCSALKSLIPTGMDCACLLVTANVPIQLPINRTLALSLPRACKMGGVPLQCKGKYISQTHNFHLLLCVSLGANVICTRNYANLLYVAFAFSYFAASAAPLPAPGILQFL